MVSFFLSSHHEHFNFLLVKDVVISTYDVIMKWPASFLCLNYFFFNVRFVVSCEQDLFPLSLIFSQWEGYGH